MTPADPRPAFLGFALGLGVSIIASVLPMPWGWVCMATFIGFCLGNLFQIALRVRRTP